MECITEDEILICRSKVHAIPNRGRNDKKINTIEYNEQIKKLLKW